ncbi:SidA/IucD/PvdA family monooxygenase [Streptomyces sp. NPDC059456]|uniref:SidA/IucD/PvdA family monooxygenase n=1 Tax=Streptomyces sp. NPDC059456 TaxID=3346838 RepID=UPI0036B2E69A
MTPQIDQDIVIVGAGPKGAALAAKAHVLNELGVTSLRVRILERAEVASHWTGRHGWTTGTELLGTRAEKDIGFPYDSTGRFGSLGKEIDARMRLFSWQSHLVDAGRYRGWVDAGQPRPTHRQFAAYLAWVLDRAVTGVRLQHAEVTAIRHGGGHWRLESRDADDGTPGSTVCAGLVLTGHGVPNSLLHDPRVASRLITAAEPREHVRARDLGPGSRVCLVGAGESAASFAQFLWDTFGEDIAVSVISPSLPRSRAESPAEDMVYSDPGTAGWTHLPEAQRREFINRTDRGVISPAAMTALARNTGLTYVMGRVRFVDLSPTGRARVIVDQPDEVLREDCDLVVNCTGTSPLAQFRSLLDPASAAEVEGRLAAPLADTGALMREIDPSLALRGLRPRLHVPALAGLAQGPGFANLSSLGLLSDRVLGVYRHTRDTPPPTARPAAAARPTWEHS